MRRAAELYQDRYGGRTNVPELLGQTLLEGMACGAAGLTTAVASLPEVVVDGVTGTVVRPGDTEAMRQALVRFRDDRARSDAMGQAGRQRVLAHFNWGAVVARCLDAYES